MRLHFDMLSKSRILGTSQLKALLSEAERQMQELDKAAADAEAKAHSAVSAMQELKESRDSARDQLMLMNARHADLVVDHAKRVKLHEDELARVQAAATRLQTRVTELEQRPTAELHRAMTDDRDRFDDLYHSLLHQLQEFKNATKQFLP